MIMHTNPITSDGTFTIGYDADGLAGQWPGNMTETCPEHGFSPAYEGQEFHDGSEGWDAYANGDELVWRDSGGSWIPIRQVLAQGGDR